MPSEKAIFQVRPMRPDDLRAISIIDHKITGVQRALTYDYMFNGLIGGQIDLSFVIEIEGQVVGFVLAMPTHTPEYATEMCLVQILGVDPLFRRKGVASLLIRALSEKAREKGMKTLRVMGDQSDDQLQGFFESLGFRRGRLVDYSLDL